MALTATRRLGGIEGTMPTDGTATFGPQMVPAPAHERFDAAFATSGATAVGTGFVPAWPAARQARRAAR